MNEMTSIPFGRYRHYKGKEYSVVGMARHSETLEELVIYRQEYGEHGLWVRPTQMFLETVKVEGQDLPRFEYLGPDGESGLERPKTQTKNQAAMFDRIRTAVEKNPRKITLQLARDLGVPEAEVIRAFPADRVMELDIARWEELIHSLEVFGPVRVLVSNGATTIEVDGTFGGFSTAGEFFNVQTETLDMHIRWKELAAVFAIEKPGHMDGMATRSFQFFDQTGAAAFKVFLNFGGRISPEREALFVELRKKFKR